MAYIRDEEEEQEDSKGTDEKQLASEDKTATTELEPEIAAMKRSNGEGDEGDLSSSFGSCGVSIDTVYQRVLALANKEQRGYITPQEFNLFADQAQMEIFEQYFYDMEQTKKRYFK